MVRLPSLLNAAETVAFNSFGGHVSLITSTCENVNNLRTSENALKCQIMRAFVRAVGDLA